MTGSRDVFPLGKSPALWAGRKAQYHPRHEGDRAARLRYASGGGKGRRLGGEKPAADNRSMELGASQGHQSREDMEPTCGRGLVVWFCVVSEQIDHVHFQSLKFSQPSV